MLKKGLSSDYLAAQNKKRAEQSNYSKVIYKELEKQADTDLKNTFQKKITTDDSPRRKLQHETAHVQFPYVPQGFEQFLFLPQMKYRNHLELKLRGKELERQQNIKAINKMELAEVFFNRRNKAAEDRAKENPKDVLLQKYANPEDDRLAAKPQN